MGTISLAIRTLKNHMGLNDPITEKSLHDMVVRYADDALGLSDKGIWKELLSYKQEFEEDWRSVISALDNYRSYNNLQLFSDQLNLQGIK